MDYTARDALAAGFDGVILIVREEIQDELLEHIGSAWPADLPVVPVIQGASPARHRRSSRRALHRRALRSRQRRRPLRREGDGDTGRPAPQG